MKALAFFYVVQTRGQLGAPYGTDIDPAGQPAPFVSEDSIYRAIIGLLANARTKLKGNAAGFPFPIPPGYSAANTPATFAQFTQALAAKAWVFRATDGSKCKGNTGACYTAALGLLDSLFSSGFASASPGAFQSGVFFDFSANPGDTQNGLSDPLNGILYFALPEDTSDAELQPSGTVRDARVAAKIAVTDVGQSIGTFPIIGNLKFKIYLTGGTTPNPAQPVPIIRNEELVLLRAEAELGSTQLAAATADINITRVGSGHLAPLAPGLSADSLLTELLYERRYSLMWEQGTRWGDARRYGRLAAIPVDVPGGHIASIMPVPSSECQARNLGTSCTPPITGQ